jgi:selenide,water dikinase
LAEVLRHLPSSTDPNLLVGFENSDDAGVFRLSPTQALVQTIDFFTPVVDDPYDYGQIAAANSLSDVYAMGGRPLTAMNVCCFDPETAPPEVWAKIIQGMRDKTTESGTVVVGGHTVENAQPFFGLSVTGLIDPTKVFRNDQAEVGDDIYLSKPLGTGIVTTAHKFDKCTPDELAAAVAAMKSLNADASAKAHDAGVKCATDVTGFGLAGHLFNIAKASRVGIEIDTASLPLLPGVKRLVAGGAVTAGGTKNELFLADALHVAGSVPAWLRHLVLDPQTSGGLATLAKRPVEGSVRIGRAIASTPRVFVR